MDEPVLQPIYDLETPRMAFGRVAIIGDAAFVARPHVGAGVSKACDDALALIDALDGNEVEPALKAAAPGEPVQLERQGYFCLDPDTMPDRLVFNRTVGLRDSWAKAQATQG